MPSLPATYVEGFHDLEAVKLMEYRVLGKTGLIVSKLSLGSGPLGVHYGEFDENEAIKMVREAIRKGINYIDTAYWYGQGRAETILGKALKEVPRKAYYIGTKVGRYELDYQNMFDFSVAKIQNSIEGSLKRLQLDYVDIIQVHDVEFAPSLDIVITQTLPELSRQVSVGKARFIGVTGYPVSVLKECIDKSNIDISCVLSYSRNTLIDDTLAEYMPYFKGKHIGVICASAVCMGLLSCQGSQSWHPADDSVKMQCRKAAQHCKEHNVEMAKLALWHALQMPDISTNLVGMQNMRELEINLECITREFDDIQQSLLNEIQEKYLAAVKNQHWEGKEIAQFKKALNEDIN